MMGSRSVPFGIGSRQWVQRPGGRFVGPTVLRGSDRRFFGGPRFQHRFHHRFHRGNFGGNNVVIYGGGGWWGPSYYPGNDGYGNGYAYGAAGYPDDRGYLVFPNRTAFQYPQSYYYSNYYPTTPAAIYNEAAAVGECVPVQVTGDVVTRVQQALRARRFYSGPVDGVSGASTRSAIRTYAATVGLPSNGAIDANLLASLGLQPGSGASPEICK